MPDLHHHAKPRLEFIPHHFNPGVRSLTQLALPLLLRLRLRPWLPVGIARVNVVNSEHLVDLYAQFQAGKGRVLLAFRHPEVDDPLTMFYMMSRVLPQAAKQQGVPLTRPIHCHFIYDRGMTIWAGDWLGWFFSRLGGIPIHRGKSLDRIGLKAARQLILDGRFPVAVAPEGATNGHSETISPLEPGVARLGFWCVEDLLKANRPEQVWIVPVGVQYHYPNPPWVAIDRLLSQLEADCGLAHTPIDSADAAVTEVRYQRVLRLAEYLLTQMEQFYRRVYHHSLPSLGTEGDRAPTALHTRLQRVLDVALQVSEDYFGLASQGTIIERCRRLEEAGWNAIYREDIPDLEAIPAFERGLADWEAEEATIRLRHMRLVESFVAVTASYLQDHPTPERFAEMSLLMFDLISRVKGLKMPRRPRLGWRNARITIGTPINVGDRWPQYKRDRQSSKQAVNDLTNDLQQALEALITSPIAS